jgi:cytoskeleton protein RodZ
MWLSYLIVAVFVGLTVLWWLQESRPQADDSLTVIPTSVPAEAVSDDVATLNIEPSSLAVEPIIVNDQLGEKKDEAELALDRTTKALINDANNDLNALDNVVVNVNDVSQAAESKVAAISTAVFTFKGDCWVNIYDATGERIAWGVKKSGYVMTIQGIAPLRITVGKPELASIVFNDQPVDMSAFNVGNIAKFNLPIVE